MSVLIETTLGDIVVDLYISERKKCCLNFLKLCKIKYYNYCLFFSVQRSYVAQTGDPSGTGRGGESIFQKIYGDQARYFDMEMKPKIKHKKRGLVSFANNGNNQHGSQFFLTLGNALDYLDGRHTVFGEISEGFDVLDKINEAICDEKDRPYQDIRINHTIILDDPFDDPDGLQIPEKSPEPTEKQLQSDRIGADEKIDEFEGKTVDEIQDIIEEKDLKIGTQILETIGDIPDAGLKPPENVLFICKLNPVTTADDLEIIFSRFGQILSCEIIRDHKTGDSLCYGFIEFAKVDECEKAYLKMENVLIDDRRIHVDFCQSIAMHKWSKSKLQGKYLFASKDNENQYQVKPGAKRLEMKEKSQKGKEYEMVFENMKSHYEESKTRDRRRRQKRRYSNPSDSGSSFEDMKQERTERKRQGATHTTRKHSKHSKRSESTERSKSRKDSFKKNVKCRKEHHSNSSEDDHYKSSRRREKWESQVKYGKDLKRKPGVHRFERIEYDNDERSIESKKKRKPKKQRKRQDSSSGDTS